LSRASTVYILSITKQTNCTLWLGYPHFSENSSWLQ